MGKMDILASNLPFWIIWYSDGAHNPYDLYATQEEAIRAANDRAILNPKIVFYVMQAVAHSHVPPLEAKTTLLGDAPKPSATS